MQTYGSLPRTSIPTPPTNSPPTTSVQSSQSSLPLEEPNIENMMHATNSNSNDVDIISSSTTPTCSRHQMLLREKAHIDYSAIAGKMRLKTLLSSRHSLPTALVST